MLPTLRIAALRLPLAQSGHPWLGAVAAAAYLLLALLCAAAWRIARQRQPAHSWLWAILVLAQLFLATDALFAIRLDVAEMGRTFFQQHGWYGHRYPVQLVLSAAAFLAVPLLAASVSRRSGKFPSGSGWAFLGTLLGLLVFAISGISMHFIEELLTWPSDPISLGNMIRVLGCVLTAFGAWRSLQVSPHGQTTGSTQ